MTGKFFNVVRVYPSTTKIYDRKSMASELLDMEGYQRWNSLRESKTLREHLDIYIKKDVNDQVEIESLKLKLLEFDLKYDQLVKDAELIFEQSLKTLDDWKTLQSSKVNANIEANTLFTNWLTSEFTKMTYNETV